MMKMNLTTDPWIPVVWNDGRPGMVSLREAFERGADIQDLAVRPHERIALMRLLICVAQAALDGPKDRADWQACRPRIAPAATAYLQKWHHAFELFGDGQRFLQVNNLAWLPGRKEDVPLSKLDLALATGNAPTLFDNGGSPDRRIASPMLALSLLSYQCFSPCGRIGEAKWGGTLTPGGGSSAHSPCIASNALHALLKTGNILDTIHLNLLTKETVEMLYGSAGWGQPVWEAIPQSPADAARVANVTQSYLGRLLPLSRAVLINDSAASVILANGLSYPALREPTTTVVASKKGDKRIVLSGRVERETWRELHSLLVRRLQAKPDVARGPIALDNPSPDQAFDLWTGAVIASGDASIIDCIESLFSFPDGLPSDDRLAIGLALYQQGVEFAESTERRLRSAITMYYVALQKGKQRAEEIRAAFRSLKPKERQSLGELTAKAQTDFWSLVEVGQRHLQQFAISDVPMNGNQVNYSETVWGKRVLRAASEAYSAACSQETARQLQAFVLGKEELFRSRPNTDE